MPDISGFTQFVNDTEILHSQQIVQELLETLIECNKLDLQVGEIEGDAIFFYRLGNKPDMPALLNQVETMFTSFHQHLMLYEQQRVCPCKACETAVNLSLKIVSHYGEVTGIAVKNHKKLFGKDVILIHRLLKNNLEKREYVLLTDPVVTEVNDAGLPTWYTPHQAVEKYDVGEVQFYFSDLSRLHENMPPPQSKKYDSAKKAKSVMTFEKSIDAPVMKVFSAIFDLPQRVHWMEGVKGIEPVTHDHIHREGTKHRCIIGDKNNPVIVTESVKISPDHIEMVEMDEKGMGGCRYILQKISAEKTKINIDLLVRNNFIVKTMFNLMMKSRYARQLTKSLENLQQYVKPQPVTAETV